MDGEQPKATDENWRPAKGWYRVRLGNDFRYHFENPELRRKEGDSYVFTGTEPGLEGRFRPEMNDG